MSGATRSIAFLFTLAVVVAACGGTDEADRLVAYERVWPDGFTETTEVFEDGRVSMLHGESLERFTLSEADIGRLKAALELPVVAGSEGDSPVRTLTLTDGEVIDLPRADPDSIVYLLDRLTDTHSLDERVTDIAPVVVPSPSPDS